jgi:Zn finger protein HypA/HybF involved in hydrogenase expression
MWKCNECGKVFKKKVGPRTYEVVCPKCHSTDVEPA